MIYTKKKKKEFLRTGFCAHIISKGNIGFEVKSWNDILIALVMVTTKLNSDDYWKIKWQSSHTHRHRHIYIYNRDYLPRIPHINLTIM